MSTPKHAVTRPALSISPKVAAATAAAAASTVLVWVLEATVPGLDIPAAVEAAGTVLITFAAGYLIRDNR